MPTNCYVLLLYAYKLLCTSFVRLQIALYFFCTLQVGTSCVMNGFELLCTVLTYPPAWSWVGLPGSSCKPAPPGAGGAVTTGDWKITIRTIYHDISGYIFQNISVEINCGQFCLRCFDKPCGSFVSWTLTIGLTACS